ncbi:Nitrate ABC transporter nitrate-binding protein [Paramagnetospirillum magnetotacticum MS-1]|uniref:Nitrate ABC transporter nitrate-binding protein n=1 Tax=Paramagnetospirillum magnetotacticum MS-1 TaxID=272627 RepID=A0A0C2UX11_PARME|nr:CmpA/NrtA family ABC transporter substrate-binding protein [Paramagnetospirillum magnetotacticum]KIL97371.1 Nitrate ABC transporter nitrate-binding protein [Paramagnetospirillum magnetotacticum MS-1]
MSLEKIRLKLGMVPLIDAAPLVVAKERGFFAEMGLEVELSREASWASIRDKVAVGALDGAQMLAPMPLAMSLGLSPLKISMAVGMALNLGGNTITIGNALWERMQAADPESMAAKPISARALKAVIDQDKALGKPPMTFATVYPYSPHAAELRLWMEAAGIDTEKDVQLTVVPPPQMISFLSAGNIVGYSVGEPWGSLAVRMNLGRIAATSRDIFAGRLEKVFAVTQSWAEDHPETHLAVLQALISAARWCDENRCELAELLAQPQYVNAPVDALMAPLLGENGLPKDLLTFHNHAANFPWRSQAMWYLEMMKRWGLAPAALDSRAAAEDVFRPDLYRVAALGLGLRVPLTDYKTEGTHAAPWTLLKATQPVEMGPDLMLGGGTFDPFASRVADLPRTAMTESGDLS